MRVPTLIAAAVMAATFFLHVIGGGADYHTPMQAAPIDLLLRAVSAVVWHGISAILALQAVALLWLSRHPDRAMSAFLLALQIAFAGIFLFYGQTMLGTIWVMGQWTIFLVLAGLIAWGMRAGARAPV
jgi:hypothetical protein